jgi:hypothetical protein
MKLEYLTDITDPLVRLYDFDSVQSKDFRQAITQIILKEKKSLQLQSLSFVESINCKLTLRLAEEDKGITTSDNINFFCDLTINGFENMAYLIEPFCEKENGGYQWLYDLSIDIDFLFSPKGQW